MGSCEGGMAGEREQIRVEDRRQGYLGVEVESALDKGYRMMVDGEVVSLYRPSSFKTGRPTFRNLGSRNSIFEVEPSCIVASKVVIAVYGLSLSLGVFRGLPFGPHLIFLPGPTIGMYLDAELDAGSRTECQEIERR
jgi:hypothetical protein